nr:DNA cytosine methyltransferase [Solimonas marina]
MFCGAGGLDLGFQQAGFRICIALDISAAAVRTHHHNFPSSDCHRADLAEIKAAGVVALVKQSIQPGSRIGVIGGPPCQGFSRANTRADSDDPRNLLPRLYVNAVEELKKMYKVEFVLFENVLGIRDKKHQHHFTELKKSLDALGFAVTDQELCAADFGVAQSRRRILVSGLRKNKGYGMVVPRKRSGPNTVRAAIGHIEREPTYFVRGAQQALNPVHENHWTMMPKSPRFEKPEESTGDGRSFKRLRWELVSPTVAYGHREIHVHPSGRRRLSIYEAMLLQGFPPEFVIKGNLSEQVEQVSNAVPPPLARSIANAVKLALCRNQPA